MKQGCLFFLAKFIKCVAPILPGKFEFTSGKKIREFWPIPNV